jgi:orotidine-5'-phosphate decarboxylase
MKIFENVPSIIPSLDVDLVAMKNILEEIGGLRKEIGGLKIGSLLVWRYGLNRVVEDVKTKSTVPIIFDAQKAGTDIPAIVEQQVELVAEAGVDAFIASPFGGGGNTLEAFISRSFKCEITPIVLLEMTHPMANEYLIEDVGKKILLKSLELGVENFVAPANNPERVKLYKDLASDMSKKIKIFSPGVGPQGGGPDSAVKAGTDFVIVGRSIIQAKSPAKEVADMYKLIVKAYDLRRI